MGSWQNYKYNGKELQTSGMYDYGARFYMPDVGIFGQHDPLSEKIGTPYAYVNNSPVNLIDPTGMKAEKVDDIVIKGRNNSSITIKTNLID